jgi:hypothetical protein
VLVAPTPSNDDDRPATRRDLSLLRKVTEANVRAGFAELAAEMERRFSELRVETAQGFDKAHQQVAELRIETTGRFVSVERRMAGQTRFLFTTMVTLFAALAGLILQVG